MDTFSYSKLDCLCQCGFKYRLKYEEGHRVFCNSLATEFGTLIHETEETIANTLKNQMPVDYITLKNNFIIKTAELQYKYATDYFTLDKSNRTYCDKAYFYLDTGIYRLENFLRTHTDYELVAAELPFEVVYKDICTFNGFIDRLFKNKQTGEYLVQDIKSYAVPVEKNKLTTPLQFVVYSYAVADLFNCEYDKILCQYDLPLCDMVQQAGTKGYMARGLTKIDSIFATISQKNFEPNQTPLCAWCEYSQTNKNAPEESKFLCPYFSHWTRENKKFTHENEWQGAENHEIILESYNKKYNITV